MMRDSPDLDDVPPRRHFAAASASAFFCAAAAIPVIAQRGRRPSPEPKILRGQRSPSTVVARTEVPAASPRIARGPVRRSRHYGRRNQL
jgi:hypothetical protein